MLMELIESTDHELSKALIDLPLETVHLREEEFEMHEWSNATIKYLCTHLNYSVMLMYSAIPPTQTPKGNKKLVKLNVVCVLLMSHLRNHFIFPAQSAVIVLHLDCFIRAFLQVTFS